MWRVPCPRWTRGNDGVVSWPVAVHCLRPMLLMRRISRPKSNVGVSYGPGCSNTLVPRIRDNGVYLQRKLSLGPRLNGRALKPSQGPRGAKVRLGACRSKRVGLSDGQRRMSPPPTTSNGKIAVILTRSGQSMCRVCNQLPFLSHNRIHSLQRRDNRSRTRPFYAETKIEVRLTLLPHTRLEPPIGRGPPTSTR